MNAIMIIYVYSDTLKAEKWYIGYPDNTITSAALIL